MAITQCSYCELDSGGNHASHCPLAENASSFWPVVYLPNVGCAQCPLVPILNDILKELKALRN